MSTKYETAEAALSSKIQIDDPDLGKFHIFIPDVKTPLWHGHIDLGVLSIYQAGMVGEALLPCYGMIYVLSTKGDEEAHDVGFAMFDMRYPAQNAVGHLVHMVRNVVTMRALKESQTAAAHGHVH